MKKIILFTLLLIGYSTCMYAQKVIEVTGLVTDAQEEPMIGVNVTVQDAPGLGAITDINGKYKIKIEPYQRLVFSYIGFEKKVVLVKEEKIINVVLKEAESNILDEVTVTGTGVQKKVTVTGAVTTVDLKDLKTPTSSITTRWPVMWQVCLPGRLPDNREITLPNSGFVESQLSGPEQAHWC